MCHPIQIRETANPCKTIASVCSILWYLNDTIQHCRGERVCNTTAIGKITTAIEIDFFSWVSACELIV